MGLKIKIGQFPKGPQNSITDVAEVRVGHTTLDRGPVQTGVTAIIPKENIFDKKLIAASHVINGFSKPTGLTQINELGTLEAPIVLTNTLSVGTTINASIKYMLHNNPDIGVSTGTVNCPVLECNDMRLNDIRKLSITENDVFMAIENASDLVLEGSVGAGRGMRCHQLKGGIGTSSRIIKLDKEYTIGVLVLSNHGKYSELKIEDKRIADYHKISNQCLNDKEKEQGSIIVIIATDIPLNSRQLKRVAKRAMSGIAKTGATSGNGSGEIALAFSTHNVINHEEGYFTDIKCIMDYKLDEIFAATIDAVYESILSSMLHSSKMIGHNNFVSESLRDILKEQCLFGEYIPKLI